MESFVVVEEDDEEDEGFILASSASKAGARVLTMASRSDCGVKDWIARGTKIKRASEEIASFCCLKSLMDSPLKEE